MTETEMIGAVHLATPRTLTADAYREFCWGAGLPETPDGYGVILAADFDGDVYTHVLDDTAYTRMLIEARVEGVAGVTIPAGKVIKLLPGWPDLDPGAASVWH